MVLIVFPWFKWAE